MPRTLGAMKEPQLLSDTGLGLTECAGRNVCVQLPFEKLLPRPEYHALLCPDSGLPSPGRGSWTAGTAEPCLEISPVSLWSVPHGHARSCEIYRDSPAGLEVSFPLIIKAIT